MNYKKLDKIDDTKNIRVCPLCSHEKSRRLLRLEYALFDDNPLSPVNYLSSCSHCGFVFYDTESTETDFNDFYKDHYLIQAKADYAIKDYLNINKYTDGLIREYGLSDSSRIVDVGCGQGWLMRYLKSSGFENIAGIELCQDYVDELNGEGYEACYGSAFDMPIEKESADFLIYRYIFEHFYDLHTAVKAASEHLAPGGYVLAEVPDAKLYNSFEGYAPLHYLILEHINHFDLPHIEFLFGTYGLKLIDSKHLLLDIAEDYPVPIMSCLFQKTVKPVSVHFSPDFELAENMLSWFEECDNLSSRELEELQESQREVCVWGISYRTAMHLAMTPLRNCNIRAFFDIDPRKQKKTLLGRKIISPDMLRDISEDAAVVIGAGPSSRSMDAQLREQGFTGQTIRLI